MSERKWKILLIEDNPYDVVLLNAALENAELDYELIELTDGAAALDFIRGANPKHTTAAVDLAVIDLNLPRYDVIQVLEALRKSERFQDLAVIVTSSSSSPQDRAKVEQLGLEQFLSKPSDLDGFLEIGTVIKRVLVDIQKRI